MYNKNSAILGQLQYHISSAIRQSFSLQKNNPKNLNLSYIILYIKPDFSYEVYKDMDVYVYASRTGRGRQAVGITFCIFAL